MIDNDDDAPAPARPNGARCKGTALITGASSGLGEEFAWQLAAAGHDLVLVARRADRLSELADRITQVAGVTVETLPADLASADGRARVAARLRSGAPSPVGLLVNNAGFALGQRFVGGDLAREQQGIDVMVTAVLELSHAACAAMVPRGRGAILNVSSIAAGTAMGTYAAAKAWVRSFTEGLAGELRGSGVTATALCPGLVRTEFHEAADMDESAWPEYGWLRAPYVVDKALAAVRRGAVVAIPSLRYKAAAIGLQVMPRAVVRAIAGPRTWNGALKDG